VKHPTISIASGLPRPTWRGRLHAWAFYASIPAALTLVMLANGSSDRFAVAVYGASLMAVFGVSAAYHRLAQSAVAQRRMQRLDHSTIYLMIAGTYTPVCLVALPRAWGVPALAVVWVCAGVGIVLKLVGSNKLLRWSNALYPVLGWAALVMLPALVRSLSMPELILLVLGGVLYSAGAVVFFRHRPDPRPSVFGYHEIWHACTVAAGASHFAMVALVTVH
jgi:hemolysin III